MIDEATTTTIERRVVRHQTLPAQASTTTVFESFYFGQDLARRRPSPEPKASGSVASLALECEEPVESGPSGAIADRGVMGHQPSLPACRSRNAAAIALIESWLADTSGYDEEVWPRLKARIEESRTSTRKRFSE